MFTGVGIYWIALPSVVKASSEQLRPADRERHARRLVKVEQILTTGRLLGLRTFPATN